MPMQYQIRGEASLASAPHCSGFCGGITTNLTVPAERVVEKKDSLDFGAGKKKTGKKDEMGLRPALGSTSELIYPIYVSGGGRGSTIHHMCCSSGPWSGIGGAKSHHAECDSLGLS